MDVFRRDAPITIGQIEVLHDKAWWAQYRADKRERIRVMRNAWAKANRDKANAIQRRYRARRKANEAAIQPQAGDSAATDPA